MRALGMLGAGRSRPRLPMLNDLLSQLTRKGRLQRHREALARARSAGDLDGIDRACRAVLSVAPEDTAALKILAHARLRRGDLARTAQLYAEADRIQFGAGVETRLCTPAYMDPEKAARGEPYVGVLDDVLLDTAYWIAFRGDRAYAAETHGRNLLNSPLVRGRGTGEKDPCFATFRAPDRAIDTPCLLLGGDDNYSHWLTRNVIKLALIEGRADLAGLPMLVNEDLRGYQREYLDLLGIPGERLMPVARNALVHCRTLHVPTMLRNHPRMDIGIEWLRRRLAHLLVPEAAAADRIFLSRRDSPVRVLVNEDEVIAALAPLGFRTIVAGEMTVAEQIRAFSGARTIVAAHGAGLTNLVYAPAGARVLEIASSRVYDMGDFTLIARHRGLDCRQVVSTDYAPTRSTATQEMHQDYRVDVPAVLGALRAAAPELPWR